MKRSLVFVVPSIVLFAAAARAETGDCLTNCTADVEPPPAAQDRINLCDHKAVREIARIDNDLAPVKEAISIATNPTGFVIKQVDQHIVHIPEWVTIAMDPRGYVRTKAIEYVRNEAKKAVGVDKGCSTELAGEQA